MRTKTELERQLPITNISYLIAIGLGNCLKENIKVLKKERMKKNDTKTKRNI